jgi:hypothetical protein
VWVRCTQAFACIGLLHCRELGPAPGDNHRSRELLTQLAFGVEDWITEAALFGLAVAAWADPGCRAEVAQAVAERYRAAHQATAQHVVTILPGLSRLVLIVPGVDDSTRGRAIDVLRADEAAQEGA